MLFGDAEDFALPFDQERVRKVPVQSKRWARLEVQQRAGGDVSSPSVEVFKKNPRLLLMYDQKRVREDAARGRMDPCGIGKPAGCWI